MTIPLSKTSCIYKITDVTKLLDLSDIFGNSHPVEVDVGCGKGRFLLARAKSFPEHNFLGIDRMNGRMEKLDRWIIREQVNNICLIEMEADYVISNLIPDNSVSVYYIFFPDPWPKRRHHKNRLLKEPFLNALYRTLIPGGVVNFSTDHQDYFETGRKLFVNDERFTEIDAFQRTEEEKTDFELIFADMQIGNCSFRK